MSTPTDKPADGGPAFPRDNPNWDGNWDKFRSIGGMSLRDYFAAHAPEIVLDPGIGATAADAAAQLGIPAAEYRSSIHFPKIAARAAYIWADAMLAERAKP